MSSVKIDRRVVLQSNSLDELTKIANSLDLSKVVNEWEYLGAAIESLLEIKRLFVKKFIELDIASKERIHTMIGFLEYGSKLEVVNSAIKKHRKKIIKKIEQL